MIPEHLFPAVVGAGVAVGVGGGEGVCTVTKVMFTRQVGCVIGSVPVTRPTQQQRVIACFLPLFSELPIVKLKQPQTCFHK